MFIPADFPIGRWLKYKFSYPCEKFSFLTRLQSSNRRHRVLHEWKVFIVRSTVFLFSKACDKYKFGNVISNFEPLIHKSLFKLKSSMILKFWNKNNRGISAAIKDVSVYYVWFYIRFIIMNTALFSVWRSRLSRRQFRSFKIRDVSRMQKNGWSDFEALK